MIEFIKEFKGTLIVCFIIIALRVTGILNIHLVSGLSMYPNFNDGDIVITSILPSVSRLDVVVANPEGGKMVIKRVIGLPNETISSKSDYLYADGVCYDKEYVRYANCADSKDESWQTGSGEYFIAGDNRCGSRDSRAYGPIEKNKIKGKVLLHFKTGSLLNKN